MVKLSADEWLACDDPAVLLYHMPGWPSDRKKRLFVLACCHRVGHLFDTPEFRGAVALAERVARGAASLGEMQTYHDGSFAGRRNADLYSWNARGDLALAYGVTRVRPDNSLSLGGAAADAVGHQAYETRRVADPDRWAAATAARRAEQRQQARLWHDLLGNPFAPAALDPAWVAWGDGTVARMAGGIDEAAAFDRLPILADALEDAGCADPAILAHCRGPGPHVRGCWVIDLLLGKERSL